MRRQAEKVASGASEAAGGLIRFDCCPGSLLLCASMGDSAGDGFGRARDSAPSCTTSETFRKKTTPYLKKEVEKCHKTRLGQINCSVRRSTIDSSKADPMITIAFTYRQRKQHGKHRDPAATAVHRHISVALVQSRAHHPVRRGSILFSSLSNKIAGFEERLFFGGTADCTPLQSLLSFQHQQMGRMEYERQCSRTESHDQTTKTAGDGWQVCFQ